MFIPNCCNKCGCSCGFLPHTIQATFSGFPDKLPAPVDGADSTSCYGTGASIGISSPGGAPEDKGPIESVFLLTKGQCYAEPGRVSPVLSAKIASPQADLTVTLEEFEHNCRPAWKIASITATGDEGLAAGGNVVIEASPGDVTLLPAAATYAGKGAVTVTEPGRYYRPVTGQYDRPIVEATVGQGVRLRADIQFDGGDPPRWSVGGLTILYAGVSVTGNDLAVAFNKGDRTFGDGAKAYVTIEDGKAVSATVTNGGEYWRDTDVESLVADVTFAPSGGTGGLVRGVVDDDQTSKTFGQVVDLVIDEPGDGYLGWQWTPPRCIDSLNGRTITLRAMTGDTEATDTREGTDIPVGGTPLVRTCIDACFGTGGNIVVHRRVKPRMVGRFGGFNVGTVYLEDSATLRRGFWLDEIQKLYDDPEGFDASELDALDKEFQNVSDYPLTWGVLRFEDTVNQYEVGDIITVAFESPETNPLKNRKVELAAASIVVSEVIDPDTRIPTQSAGQQGWLSKVTVVQPGEYYQETLDWDGVPGQLEYVKLVSQGSGYAKLGRLAPSLVAGFKGELPVFLEQRLDECDVPYWEISEVDFSSGSAVYTEATSLTVTLTDGKQQAAAKIVAHTREEPTVTATMPSVDGVTSPATFEVTLAKRGPVVTGWPPSSLTVQSAVWSVSGVTIQASGEGYLPGAAYNLTFATTDTGTGAGGAAIAGADGKIASVVLAQGGEYYRQENTIQELTYVHRGEYYKESKDQSPYIGLRGVDIVQTLPSNGFIGEGQDKLGNKAGIKAVVDDDPYSATFGRIISAEVILPGPPFQRFGVLGIKLASGGTGYGTDTVIAISKDCLITDPTDPAYSLFDYIGPASALAVPVIGENGTITEITITDRGGNYECTPEVTIQSKSGSGAEIGFVQMGEYTTGEEPVPFLFRSGPKNCKYDYYCPENAQRVSVEVRDGHIDVALEATAVSVDDPPVTDDTSVTRWIGLFRSDTQSTDCSTFSSSPYVSPYAADSGQVTLEAGGQFVGFNPCCYCPCDAAQDTLSLEDCGTAQQRLFPVGEGIGSPADPPIWETPGIDAIIVEVEIEVDEDPEAVDPCPNYTTTLTLEDIAGDWSPSESLSVSRWFAEERSNRWRVEASLECGAGYSIRIEVGPNDFPFCSAGNLSAEFNVPLPTAVDFRGERCCPDGTDAQVFTFPGFTVTVTVTVVEGTFGE